MDFQHRVSQRVELTGNLTIRDETSVLRIASGMLKVLCPHGDFQEHDFKLCMDLAVENRQRIADWLHRLAPGEFKSIKIGYKMG